MLYNVSRSKELDLCRTWQLLWFGKSIAYYRIEDVIEKYKQYKKDNYLFDFEDMILNFNKRVASLPVDIAIIDEAQEKWGFVKPAYVHKALNAVLQGSSANITKTALLKIWKSGICNEMTFNLFKHSNNFLHQLPKLIDI